MEKKIRRSAPQTEMLLQSGEEAPQTEMLLQSGEEAINLPEEVVMKEILHRLPVKSLLRFRCVSKSWCSLIGSKSFIKQHLKHSFAQHFIFYDKAGLEMKQCSLPSLFEKPFTDPITCDAADLGSDLGWKFLGSRFCFEGGCCNGLVCFLGNDNKFILWNPTTKNINYLPSLLDEIQVEYGDIVAYGFGFDEFNDDYKVYARVNLVDAEDTPIGMIYSLKSNSWKVIEDRDVSPFDYEDDEGVGVYVSGKLHWSMYKQIFSFDLNSHVYEVVELPSYTTGDLCSVEVVGGCLGAQFRRPNGDIDIWLMKEYGVKESFDKVATVPCLNRTSFTIPTELAISPNGEVLLVYASTVMIYDPKSDVLRHPQITGLNDDIGILSLGIVTESLVSVDPDTKQER